MVLVLLSVNAMSQIEVKKDSFRRIEDNFLMIDREKYVDNNNKAMALIKISTENINAEERAKLRFKGNRETDFKVENKYGELYLYITASAATFMEIIHPDYGKTEFRFPSKGLSDYFGYEMVVVLRGADDPIKQQNTYLNIVSDQPNAMIYIDEEFIGQKEGFKPLKIGSTHTYKIECDLFHTETGSVTLDSEETVVIEKKLRPAYGFLNVISVPVDGAMIFIDNKNVGSTPYYSDKIVSGTYKVRLVKEMYKTTEQDVVVTDGNTTKTEIVMPANFVNVTVKTDSQSDIYLNDEYKGRGSWSGQLMEGAYFIEVKKEFHKTMSQNLNVTLGKDIDIIIDAPQPICGFIDVTTYPSRADVYVDDKLMGQSPIIKSIPVGYHELRVEKDGYSSMKRNIEIRENETLPIEDTLHNKKKSVYKAEIEKEIVSSERQKELLNKSNDFGVTFMTANFAYSVAPQASYGLTFGQVKKFGWYVSVMSDFDFIGFNTIDEDFENVAVNGVTESTRLSVMGGFVAHLGGPVCARVGVGYGMRVKVAETIAGSYVEYAPDTYKGLEMTAGLQFNLRKITLGIDAVTANFKYMEVRLGIGINWN